VGCIALQNENMLGNSLAIGVYMVCTCCVYRLTVIWKILPKYWGGGLTLVLKILPFLRGG